MNRRTALKTMAVGAGAIGMGVSNSNATSTCCPSKNRFPFRNNEVYTNGKFDVEKGKDAIIRLCKFHGYPIFDSFRENLWVSDYGTGQFAKLGLAAYMYINNTADRYMQMDLFMMPNQMLPEHWHLEAEGNPAKLEAWVVRYGLSFIVGIGDSNLSEYPEIIVPICHDNGRVKSKHVVPTKPGQCVKLAKVESRHWQFAGPFGAIVTEVANVHTDSGVRHTDKAVNDHFLGL